jgi:hypothetical protein
MSDRLVTVATFSLPFEVHLAKAKLESEGIECFVADENMVSLNWLYAGAIGGIKLRVSESDYLQAKKILNAEPLDFTLRGEDAAVLTCPRCHASKVRVLKAATVFWRQFFRRPKASHECLECGQAWSQSEPR